MPCLFLQSFSITGAVYDTHKSTRTHWLLIQTVSDSHRCDSYELGEAASDRLLKKLI